MCYGADEVTVEFECFYSILEPVAHSELQFIECRGMDSIVAGGELSLFSFFFPDSFDNQISWQRITLMGHTV